VTQPPPQEQQIPELNPGPVVQFNADGVITSLNWSAFAILGQEVKRGAQVQVAIPGMEHVDIDAAIQEGTVTTHIAQVRDRYFQFMVRGFKNLAMGGVYGTDVTERLQREQALARQVNVRQAEKLAALGKLAAGMAHWLNNPAAAAARSANQLGDSLTRLDHANSALQGRDVTAAKWEEIVHLRDELTARVGTDAVITDAFNLSEREDVVLGWLEDHGVQDAWEPAPMLARLGVDAAWLDRLADGLPEGALGDVASWLAASLETDDLLKSMQETTGTISHVIQAFKAYTYMDQGEVQEIDINGSLDQTLTVLEHRLVGVDLVRDFAGDLPHVMGSGSELNQVWTNLIDNAIDAVAGGGTIRVTSSVEDGSIVVEVADDGPGIPEDDQYRVFEPFFTTKDVGQGTGLGLDTVRRGVEGRFGGKVTFTSEPGETVFEVRLPIVSVPA
jgi:signal transduction histidine kinase